MNTETEMDLNRDAVIARIRTALKRRSGRAWSVTGGRGTAWGWITVDVPPAKRTWRHRLKEGATNDGPGNWEEYDTGQPGGHMGPADRADLARLLGLDGIHQQGLMIAASSDYYREHIERAETGRSDVQAKPYWD